MTPFGRATAIGKGPTEPEIIAMMEATGMDRAEIMKVVEECRRDEIWMNDLYQVNVRGRGEPWIHLSIKRIDKAPIHDWRHLQAIKNELVGPEHDALELYPAESRLVDTANQYHLWVLADAADRIPVGWTERLVMDQTPGANSRQRAFDQGSDA